MKINARIDVLQLVNETAKAQRNLAYSTHHGINETAKQIRDAMQAKVKAKFTLRSARSQSGLPRGP